MRRTVITILFLFLTPFLVQAKSIVAEGAQNYDRGTNIQPYMLVEWLPSSDYSGVDSVSFSACRGGSAAVGTTTLALYQGNLDGTFDYRYNLIQNSPVYSQSIVSLDCSATSTASYTLNDKVYIDRTKNYVFEVYFSNHANINIYTGTSSPDFYTYLASSTVPYMSLGRFIQSTLGGTDVNNYIYDFTVYNYSDDALDWGNSIVQREPTDINNFWVAASSSALFSTSTGRFAFSKEEFSASLEDSYSCSTAGFLSQAGFVCALADAFELIVLPDNSTVTEFWNTLTVSSKSAFPFSLFYITRDTAIQLQDIRAGNFSADDFIPSQLRVATSSYDLVNYGTATIAIANSVGNNKMDSYLKGLYDTNAWFGESDFWQLNVKWFFSVIIWVVFGLYVLFRGFRQIGYNVFDMQSDEITSSDYYSDQGNRIGGNSVRRRKYKRNLT